MMSLLLQNRSDKRDHRSRRRSAAIRAKPTFLLVLIFDFPLQAKLCGFDPLVVSQPRLVPNNRLLDPSKHLLEQFFDILGRGDSAIHTQYSRANEHSFHIRLLEASINSWGPALSMRR
jgi:hypothetical protein